MSHNISKTLKILLITIGDRIFNEECENVAGPTARSFLEKFFNNKAINFQINSAISSDEPLQIYAIIQHALEEDVDLIFTMGGTGIGPRDNTPDVVLRMADKIIPGIMENIRLKAAEKTPSAVLCRSVAGIINKTQIYTLPGNLDAIEDYLTEIAKTLEHALCILESIDVHKH